MKVAVSSTVSVERVQRSLMNHFSSVVKYQARILTWLNSGSTVFCLLFCGVEWFFFFFTVHLNAKIEKKNLYKIRMTRNQILKNIQRLSTERVLPDPAGLFVHLCVSTCKRY